MPYRRLPNTDLSRIKALKTAIEKASGMDFQDVAISMKTLANARAVVDKFECEDVYLPFHPGFVYERHALRNKIGTP